MKIYKACLFAALFCIVHGKGGDFGVHYEGMDKKTVTQIINQTYEANFDFVDQQSYNAFVKAHQPKISLKTS